MSEQDFALPSWMRWQALPVPLATSSLSDPAARKLKPMVEAPCRRCLHDTTPGEEVVLVSYDPFFGDSPYRSRSPIFIHAKSCEDYNQHNEGNARMVPLQQRSRLLSIRGFNKDHMMIRAELGEGVQMLEFCKEMLTEGDVVYIHLHYARHGCFAVKVERDMAGASA